MWWSVHLTVIFIVWLSKLGGMHIRSDRSHPRGGRSYVVPRKATRDDVEAIDWLVI
jgi:hypothetical protein